MNSQAKRSFVLSYFRGIEVRTGVPLLILLYNEDSVKFHAIRNWLTVVEYDDDADLHSLQSIIVDVCQNSSLNSELMISLQESSSSLRLEEITRDQANEIIAIFDAIN